jgi:hypothetical protein
MPSRLLSLVETSHVRFSAIIQRLVQIGAAILYTGSTEKNAGISGTCGLGAKTDMDIVFSILFN